MGTELERIALLAKRFAPAGGSAAGAGAITTGIGDDAAVLALASINAAGRLVWTVDAQVEGTHFRRAWLSWEDIGWRSFMAAASDLAAMGAAPVAALSSLVLSDVTDEELGLLADGQAAAAREVGAPIVGGNLARGTETSITTTLLGSVVRPVLRSGARPGDRIWLAGPVGRAAAGLVAIAGDVGGLEACKAAWRRPRALVAVSAVKSATAALDVSDGLARDAGHLAEASGVVLVLDAAALHDPVLAEAAAVLGRDALELALGGGEDYALLATSPTPLEGFIAIGEVEAGAPAVLVAQEGPASTGPSFGFRSLRVKRQHASAASCVSVQNPAQAAGIVRPARIVRSVPSSGAVPVGPACAAIVLHCADAATSIAPSGELPSVLPCDASAAQHCFKRATLELMPPPSFLPASKPASKPASSSVIGMRTVGAASSTATGTGGPASTTGVSFFGQPARSGRAQETTTAKATRRIEKDIFATLPRFRRRMVESSLR